MVVLLPSRVSWLLGILPQQNCGCCSVLTTPDRILYFTIFVGPKNDVRRRRLHQVVAARREPSHFFTFHLEQPAGDAENWVGLNPQHNTPLTTRRERDTLSHRLLPMVGRGSYQHTLWVPSTLVKIARF